MSDFNTWFNTFIEEKDLPYKTWEIEDRNGVINFIDNDFIIDTIKNCPNTEQHGIKNMLIKIDFANGDVNDYFKHLATGLVLSR